MHIADLIEVFKMAKTSHLYRCHPSFRTRGHLLKLVKHRCHLEMRRHFFSERVINRWNKLDQVTISASTINAFKSRLEKERLQKMGLFMNYSCLLGLGAVFNIWSGQTCEFITCEPC